MPINSRQKGARGERLWRDELREQGFKARRGQQFAGGTDSPDVICTELDHLHFEVKVVEALNLRDAVDQACRDAGSKTPVVAHKRNNSPWLVTMLAADWFKLVKGLLHPDPLGRAGVVVPSGASQPVDPVDGLVPHGG